MRTRQGSTLSSLRAVSTFIDTNAAALGSVVNSGARRRLEEIITSLADHAATQTGSTIAALGATRRQYMLREVLLHDHMAPIARIAKVDLSMSPAIEPLRMPRGNPGAERLAAAAHGMAKAAAAYASIFIDAGLPADFMEQLADAADAMLASIDERTQSRGVRGGATEGLKAKLSEGRKIVHVLDAFIRTALKRDPALLANWNIVKRVQGTAPGPVPAGAGAAAPSKGVLHMSARRVRKLAICSQATTTALAADTNGHERTLTGRPVAGWNRLGSASDSTVAIVLNARPPSLRTGRA